MQAGGAISGTIRSASGHKLPGACVVVTDLNRNVDLPQNEAFAFFGGSYQLTGLPPGAYHVIFMGGCFGLNYATQWYSREASPPRAPRATILSRRTPPGIDPPPTL